MKASEAKEACSLYANGWSAAKIGRKFGCGATTVINALKRAGIERRGTGTQDRYSIPESELGTVPDPVLAEKYGCNPQVICYRRQRAGIRPFGWMR